MAKLPPIDMAKSLERLQKGGLPTRATLRLAEEAGPQKKLFTSDLSVNEFLLTREVGCMPISQVMGSSIYHIGRIADYKGKTGEILALSQAHREARRLAIGRMALEARAVGADAVIGVRLSERLITAGAHGKGGDDGDEVIEFTVVGTAIKAPWMDKDGDGTPGPAGEPVLTDLSGQDLWTLARDGWEPCGLLFDFCRYHIWHVMDPDNFSAGDEVKSGGDGVERARALVEERVLEQARRHGAEFVVGSDIKVTVEEVPCGWEGCRLADCDIDVVWFATGVRRRTDHKRETEAVVPPLILSMMPLGRRRRGEVVEDGEDDDEKLREAAKEAEREAAEKDEGGGE